MVDGERVCGRLCSPAAWDQVRLAGASQIALNTNGEAIKSYLLCQKVNIYPIQYISERGAEVVFQDCRGLPGTVLIIA